MKKVILSMALIATMITACKNNNEKEANTSEAKEVAATYSNSAEKFSVNNTESSLKWTAYKIGATHFGHVGIASGNMMVKEGKIESGEFTIDLSTLSAEDSEKEYNEKLSGHLKSPDFFDVEKHKNAIFTITSVNTIAADSAIVSGNLNIKDSTNNIEIPVKYTIENGKLKAASKFSIDRSKWGLTYQPAEKIKLKDKFIKDNIDFELNLTADKK